MSPNVSMFELQFARFFCFVSVPAVLIEQNQLENYETEAAGLSDSFLTRVYYSCVILLQHWLVYYLF